MMLEWAAEQGMEISRESIDLEFLPNKSNVERGVRNLVFADAHGLDGAHEPRSERHCRQLAEESFGGLATTAEAPRPDDWWSKAQSSAHDHLSRKVLSPGTPKLASSDGVLRVALREEPEGQAGR